MSKTRTKLNIFPSYHGEKWYECDICGIDYPESELIIDFKGRRVCKWDIDSCGYQETE